MKQGLIYAALVPVSIGLLGAQLPARHGGVGEQEPRNATSLRLDQSTISAGINTAPVVGVRGPVAPDKAEPDKTSPGGPEDPKLAEEIRDLRALLDARTVELKRYEDSMRARLEECKAAERKLIFEARVLNVDYAAVADFIKGRYEELFGEVNNMDKECREQFGRIEKLEGEAKALKAEVTTTRDASAQLGKDLAEKEQEAKKLHDEVAIRTANIKYYNWWADYYRHHRVSHSRGTGKNADP